MLKKRTTVFVFITIPIIIFFCYKFNIITIIYK